MILTNAILSIRKCIHYLNYSRMCQKASFWKNNKEDLSVSALPPLRTSSSESAVPTGCYP